MKNYLDFEFPSFRTSDSKMKKPTKRSNCQMDVEAKIWYTSLY